MSWKTLLAIVCLATGGIAFFLYVNHQPKDTVISVIPPEPVLKTLPKPIVRGPTVVETVPTPEPIVALDPEEDFTSLIAPPEQLDGSDSHLVDVATTIAPALVTWLLPEQQIRKWVLAVDLLADGQIPKKYPPLNFPMLPFTVDKSEGVMLSKSSNYTRANNLVKVFTAIEPALIARYYRYWLPILESAYREQGKPGSFSSRLHQAITQILAVKPLPKPMALHQPHVLYQYLDPSYEQRNDLDKLLWRLGPNNTQQLQDYLKLLQQHL